MSLRASGLQSINVKKEDTKFSLGRENRTISEYYGELVFGPVSQKKYIIEEANLSLNHAIKTGEPIDHKTADFIANGLKNWAIENGVTHYAHWFQPLTGKTAEKHDAFFILDRDDQAIEEFNGKVLIQQEPDGSSFPSGGLRLTHQARGYTVWDPSSPPFIRETKNGRTLLIPSIFISYTGESLDLKAPLLKSIRALETAATEVCKYFEPEVTKVIPTLGWEQEYFLVDEELFNARPDLVLCGRTLYGNASARGQQLDDHYFATIPERVNEFMIELEQEALRVGITIKTRHNEVAPNQYECAPFFRYVNIAADHNQLFMDLIDRVARRHGLRALLHEKPFAGLNGSGKHNNWSLATDTGRNLLNPGKDPREDLYFLTFFINVIKAIDTHADLLRASIANVGNEHRLGANEAPPAIISVFTGDNLSVVLDEFKLGINEKSKEAQGRGFLDLGIQKVPTIKLDNTDRNRTSPFPFTGNKFEFRAVGSSVNVSKPMMILNTIVADQLNQFKADVDEKVKSGSELTSAIEEVLREVLISCEKRIFNGNNYSDEWVEEAKERGLSNIKSSPEALKHYLTESSLTLFERNQIFSKEEVQARYNVLVEEYINKLEIESILVKEIANTYIIPAVVSYQNELISNVKGLNDIGMNKESEIMKSKLSRISDNLDGMIINLDKLDEETKLAHNQASEADTAQAFFDKIKPLMDEVRKHADNLELLVDDKVWPLPKYRELLFLH